MAATINARERSSPHNHNIQGLFFSFSLSLSCREECEQLCAQHSIIDNKSLDCHVRTLVCLPAAIKGRYVYHGEIFITAVVMAVVAVVIFYSHFLFIAQ